MSRPYLIVPQLVDQSTWGGDYILHLKGWKNSKYYQGKKIGQSHELSSSSQLTESITNSDQLSDEKNLDSASLIPISTIEPVSLLIKLNQAKGNSFQLHVPPGVNDSKWKPKPESWYFLENGSITLGIQPNIDREKYKKTCFEIDDFMKNLAIQISEKKIDILSARQKAQIFVHQKNPWQFTNKYTVAKNDIIDLSLGGIHHSWEDDPINAPYGNIVFEVQLEASDDEATIRAFDQGKINDNGMVRTLNIADYFQHLDDDPIHNSYSFLKRTPHEENLLTTPYYTVDIYTIHTSKTVEKISTYQHIYVRDGAIEVTVKDVSIIVGRGHSCFIPSSIDTYLIKSLKSKSVILRTAPSNVNKIK